MKCIYCKSLENKVMDSRLNDSGTSIRRRRLCQGCGKRFTSYETVDFVPVLVVKKDGRREPFNAQKIRDGLAKACEKRPVTVVQINEVIDNIEKAMPNSLDQEVPSTLIGDMIMQGLKRLDEIAYVRFACVYRQFKDVSTFLEFVRNLDEDLKKEVR